MNDPLGIHLNIAGKRLSLTIERAEEESFRRAEKRVAEVVTLYQTAYGKETESLAMAALHLALQNIKWHDMNDTAPFEEKIRQLTDELKTYLESNT
ncbi:MAG: cell division protein ZapA [Parabacteroides sp.]